MDDNYIPEGLTIIFDAPQRWGKTLGGVIFAKMAADQGRNIFSNIKLEFPHVPLDFREIDLESAGNGNESPFWNGHIFIDELNFWFDSRMSMSELNKRFSRFLLQQKKQGCHLTGTTHQLASLDKRLRLNYDFVIRPECFPKHPKKPEIIKMRVRNGPLQAPLNRTLVFKTSPYLGLYDTKHVYNPFADSKQEKAKPRTPRRIPTGPDSRFTF